MFEQSLFERAAPPERRRLWTAAASSLFQFLLIGILVLIPLEYTKAWPPPLNSLVTVWAPPPPRRGSSPLQREKIQRRQEESRLIAPKNIPPLDWRPDEDLAPPPAGLAEQEDGVPGGLPDGTRGGVLGIILTGTPGPPSPPPPKVDSPKRIRVGGIVQQARWIFHPNPLYPPLARSARIQGTVRLEAIISRQGTIESLKVISGHPMLVEAALDAVRQWRYRPTILNGEPVEVATTMDVNFTLSQ